MAHPQEKRDLLRRKYVFDNQPLELAATFVGIPLATARSWKYAAKEQGDDWDKARSAYLLAGGGLEEIGQMMLAAFIVQYQDTMERLQNDTELDAVERVKLLSSLSDSFAKNISTNKKLMPEASELATAMKLLDMQLTWVQKNQPKNLQAFIDMLEPFGKFIETEFKS